jgi:hypothetical protein
MDTKKEHEPQIAVFGPDLAGDPMKTLGRGRLEILMVAPRASCGEAQGRLVTFHLSSLTAASAY